MASRYLSTLIFGLLVLCRLSHAAAASPHDLSSSPFSPAYLDTASDAVFAAWNTSSDASDATVSDGTRSAGDHQLDLVRRDGNCPSNYNSCSDQGDASACCATNAVCSVDAAGQVACCPLGSYCTGTISRATPTASYVANSYFPFPVVTGAFGDSAACSSASSACASNYALCTQDLDGGAGFAVTISAPNGGVTVAAATTNLGASSASAVCASLSSAAGCDNADLSSCNGVATSTASDGNVVTVTVTSTGGFVVGTSAAAPRLSTFGGAGSRWAGVVAAALLGFL